MKWNYVANEISDKEVVENIKPISATSVSVLVACDSESSENEDDK